MGNGIVINQPVLLELQEELNYLKTLKSVEYADEIAEEKAFGIISDKQAEKDLQKIETRIKEIENFFANVIDVD